MARNYTTRDFFRQMPNRLLARYFERRGVLAGLDFAVIRETQIYMRRPCHHLRKLSEQPGRPQRELK
jgi:hypothetical protein